ncbi:MAG: zeta toxin family protein [Desulfomonile tiedjei]|uniref:Zeta toxin family protein n=1 Tax=Desulfomonile tiedjei TaxID=2358 RepID=A0A9D6UX19_9BACT|nr:zeta toxin family protein [Desulfomonile tiedjei]
MSKVPRLRMFAGPNGSGKSTIKSVIRPELLGVYVNPDDIEDDLRAQGYLDLGAFGISTTHEEARAFFRSSELLKKADLLAVAESLGLEAGTLSFHPVEVNSYLASVIADFLRHKLLQSDTSFTFETVMSSADKVAFLKKAQQRGFRTYLYYVATEDPIINISRVRNRVRLGGHPVPEDKIVSRYGRSLSLLADAIRHTNRAYIFDNSRRQHIWLAEVTDGRVLEMKSDSMPVWFKRAVWDKLTPTETQ